MASKRKYKGVMPSFIYPPNGGITNNFMRAMHKTYQAGGFTHPWSSNVGTRVSRSRTLNTEEFLESDAEWNFQIDTDMLWEPSEVIRLRKFAEDKGVKIVSGWTVVMKNGIWPHAYEKIEHPEAQYAPYGEIAPFSEPRVVDAVGSACLLVHRDVYEDVREHTRAFTNYYWNEEEYDPERDVHIGQDLSFADRVNRYTDHEIWYHPGCVFVHMKLTPYGPKEYTRFMQALQQQINDRIQAQQSQQ